MRKLNPFGLRVSSAVAASVLAVSAVPVVSGNVGAAQAQSCTPIHSVATMGTGASSSNASTEARNYDPDYAPFLQSKFGKDKVSEWNNNYPASVGAISAFWGLLGMDGGKEQVSFGKSIAAGVANAERHMSEYKRACPNTKFVISGYSQGASVAGDVARDISAGKVAGVTPDDVVSVVLIADPGRSSNSAYESYTGTPSTLYGPVPPGVMGKNFEIISPASGALSDRIGWTGERPGRFEGMYGKVLSLCTEDDLACSAPPNSYLRAMADYAMKESSVARFDSSLGDRIQAAVKTFTDKGGIQAAQTGNIQRVQQLAGEAALVANLGPADIPAAIDMVREFVDIVRTTTSVCGDTSLGEALGSIAKGLLFYTVPTMVTNNLNLASLTKLYNQAPGPIRDQIRIGAQPLVDSIPSYFGVSNLDEALALANKTIIVKKIIDGGLGILGERLVPRITDSVASLIGYDVKNDLKSFESQFGFFGSFADAHGSYWSSTEINNKPAAAYAKDWLAESVANALAGKSYVAQPKGKNLTDASLEKTLESQVSGGNPVCNPKDFETGLGKDSSGDGVMGDVSGSDGAGTGGTGTGGTGNGPGTGGTGGTGTGTGGTGTGTGDTGTGTGGTGTGTGGTGTGTGDTGTGTGGTGAGTGGTGNDSGTGGTGAGTGGTGTGTGGTGTGTGGTGAGTDGTGAGTGGTGTGTGGTGAGTGGTGTGSGAGSTGTDGAGTNGTGASGAGTDGTGDDTGTGNTDVSDNKNIDTNKDKPSLGETTSNKDALKGTSNNDRGMSVGTDGKEALGTNETHSISARKDGMNTSTASSTDDSSLENESSSDNATSRGVLATTGVSVLWFVITGFGLALLALGVVLGARRNRQA